MPEPPPVLAYDQRRVCGRVVVTGSGDGMTITIRPNRRLATILLTLGLLCAAGGYAASFLQRTHYMLYLLGSFLGYAAAVFLLYNAAGQGLRTQRAALSAKRLTVSSRHGTASFLRDDVVGITVTHATQSLGFSIPAVALSLRDGSYDAILAASREETAFAAEILQIAMQLPPDPLHIAHFDRLSAPDVDVAVRASGVIAEFRRRPSRLEAPVVALSAGAVGAGLALALLGEGIAIWAVGIAILLGFQGWAAFVHFSASISGGIWDGEFVFTERRWMRGRAELRYNRQEVADVRLTPSASPRRSYLCIVLRSGQEIRSERTWPTLKLRKLADTINEARRLCP